LENKVLEDVLDDDDEDGEEDRDEDAPASTAELLRASLVDPHRTIDGAGRSSTLSPLAAPFFPAKPSAADPRLCVGWSIPTTVTLTAHPRPASRRTWKLLAGP